MLLDSLREHLVGEAIVRIPRVEGELPPMWLDPPSGPRAPGEGSGVEVGQDAVVAAFRGGGTPPRRDGAMTRLDRVDVWLRTAAAPRAYELEAALRGTLVDRRQWDMGGITVIESQMWRALQRLRSRETDAGAEFTFVVS